jgi:hypothetical protein
MQEHPGESPDPKGGPAMAHKKQHSGPVPAGNQSPFGTAPRPKEEPEETPAGAPDQQQDEERRLGDYEGKGEHSLQQPGGKNDANH